MLVEFSVKNVGSFHREQKFSMVASTSTKEDLPENTITFKKYGIEKVLKSSSVWGANGSGKSNFCDSIHIFKHIILGSLLSLDFNLLNTVFPFVLQDGQINAESEFEVSFVHDNILYRYGIAILDKAIKEEWLFRNSNKRETELFHRQKQKIEYNKASFKEADDLLKIDEYGDFQILKTRENVPFISTLAQFDGEISSKIIDWFNNLNTISGIQDSDFGGYTEQKMLSDNVFKKWALNILGNFNISDVFIDTIEERTSSANEKLGIERKKKNEISFVKKVSDNQSISMPFALESAGIKKVFNTLGPFYDTLKNNKILIIDEFDSKFHTLLSKYLIQSFNKESNGGQLIIAVHDTNLLSREIFRRDQIWFIEKNENHESEVFSLLEYKEHYSRKTDSYRSDYLAGKFGAVPLFENHNLLNEVCDG